MSEAIGIAKIFRSIQGEGLLSGIPMVFIRTAGCSIGCPQCDTNYKLTQRMEIDCIVAKVLQMQFDGWVWITGGEPTDWIHLDKLRKRLNQNNYKVAIATSGVKKVSGYQFVSVSPHSMDFVQREGDQLNIVPGLNGITLDGIDNLGRELYSKFKAMYVTPLEGGSAESCIDFVMRNAHWRLGNQSHKQWGVQ